MSHYRHSKLMGLFLIGFVAAPGTPEQNTVKFFNSIKQDSSRLQEFLQQMPKGGDLHNHLSGSVAAETYIRWAAEASPELCIDRRSLSLSSSKEAPCTDESSDRPGVKTALKDKALYESLVDAWSMRNLPSGGHDHFFAAFGRFALAREGRLGEMIAEAVTHAASDHVSYVELMLSPDQKQSMKIGKSIEWNGNPVQMREELLKRGLFKTVDFGKKRLEEAIARTRQILKCNTPQAMPGCGVAVRYIFQVDRNAPPAQVFAQMIAGMEMATADPRVVGISLVQDEEAPRSLKDFSLHMSLLDYLHPIYPKAHITLHAGELTPGLVSREELRSHVWESVERGHAERIGHGVDVMNEENPFGLLHDMARRKIMVETCLSSNEAILGVSGQQHPLSLYLKEGVPVALATDDAGVLRSNLTREYQKAVEEQGLGYLQLKSMARTSLEHAFLEGTSLWKDPSFFIPDSSCLGDRPDQGDLSSSCQSFLERSEKARFQWELEKAFAHFEQKGGMDNLSSQKNSEKPVIANADGIQTQSPPTLSASGFFEWAIQYDIPAWVPFIVKRPILKQSKFQREDL